MNAVLSLLCCRWLLLIVFAAGCLCVAALPVEAAEGTDSSIGLIQANAFLQLVSDRSRMIQVSLVCVVFGCSLLWWKR